MSNPNNAIGTNGAFGGRTSVNAFNDVLSAFNGRGILSGWECTPKSGLTVQLGGDGSNRDVAIAEDPVGNKTTVDNISQSPVDVTIGAAPVSNSRIDSIVAYIEDSPSGAGETDNYTAVNLIVVAGTPASTPTAPDDSDIRTAITADGGSGTTAYYVILADVTIASGTTDIDATMITQGSHAGLLTDNIADGSVTTDKIANTAVTSSKIDWTTIKYQPGDTLKIGDPTVPNAGQSAFCITGAYVTNGGKEIGLNIPITKSAQGMTATITSSRLWIRTTASAYLIQDKPFSNYNVTITPHDGFLGVQIKNTDNSAFNITNNSILMAGFWCVVQFS